MADSTDLLSQVKQQLQAYPCNERVMALSGGIDSVVLLHLLAELKQTLHFRLSAVHVHHGLSEHGDEWARFCRRLCQQWQVAYEERRVTVRDKARESLEANARTARYQAIYEMMPTGAQLITAQHQDDQVESFLLAAKRGSGVAGLAAMPACKAFHSGQHCRPLLNCTREQIEAYAAKHQLTWVEDDSNQSRRFDRNFLRLEVMPLLRSRWPQVSRTIARSAQLCGEQQALLEQYIAKDLARCQYKDGSLQINELNSCSEPQRNGIFRLWLKQQGLLCPAAVRLTQIWQQVALANVSSEPNMQFKQYSIRRFQQRLYCVPTLAELPSEPLTLQVNQAMSLADDTEICLMKASECQPNQSESMLITMAPLTASSPVTIQYPKSMSLKVTPVNQRTQSLKKLLQGAALPPWLRSRIPLLYQGGQLLAVVGVCRCEATFQNVEPTNYLITLSAANTS